MLNRTVAWDGFSDINNSGETNGNVKDQKQTAGAKTHESKKKEEDLIARHIRRIEKLEQQLQQAGISIAEDIPFVEARAEVSRIAQRMAEIGSADVVCKNTEKQKMLHG